MEAASKIKSMGVDTEKTKKIVENSVFISTLNSHMETLHSQIFTCYFKHQLLYAHFGTQSDSSKLKTARDFEMQYQDCMTVERSSNRHNISWRDRL